MIKKNDPKAEFSLKDSYDVVVIGAGLGGLCAGAYIARDGHSLLVCEQAEQTGGYFRSFTRAGFIFDAGLKAVENAGMLLPMLNQLKLVKRVNLHRSPSALVMSDRLIALHDKQDVREFYDVLGHHFPEQRRGLEAIFRESERICAWVNLMVSIPNPLFEGPKRLLPRLPAWFVRNLPALVNYRSAQALLDVPLTNFLSRYLTDAALIRILTELFFAGTPALFGLGYSRAYLDYYYPYKGMQSVTDALGEYVIKKGGRIVTGVGVKKIIIENNQTTGVILDSGKHIKAKYVVAAADMKHTFLDMIEPDALDKDFRKRVAESGIGESAVCVFLGTDIPGAKLPLQGCSHLYVLPDYQGIDASDRKKEDFFLRTPVEMSIPCLQNPRLAPAGQSGIIISALAKTGFSDNWGTQDGKTTPAYYALKEKVADQLIDIAEKVIPGLKDHILFRDIATPYTYGRYTLNTGGSICGWTYDRQTTFHRKGMGGVKTSMLTPVENLLQAGHWTAYPGGAPVCILSGRLAADYITKQKKKERGAK